MVLRIGRREMVYSKKLVINKKLRKADKKWIKKTGEEMENKSC